MEQVQVFILDSLSSYNPKDDNAAVVLSAVNVTSSHLPSSHLVIYSVSAGLYEIHGDDGPGHGNLVNNLVKV